VNDRTSARATTEVVQHEEQEWLLREFFRCFRESVLSMHYLPEIGR
jgi:hypothetical protein